ncbi:MAG: 16S rRNA (uracil(1498)-N(3))-methyltransferase [Alphaproteobacteria bacterium CG11_big_fil_rev_8_21_14_0_20_39_49]|nr:MAG: 16S rRNA (uracil(1498)-N(3))-methyltransferase [Alphaproteobacteria bacterium CG11_big_fil_rev_8_21_14_0_20_39_49]
MPKIRIYIDNKLEQNGFVELAKEQAHYLCNVMRQKQGDEISVFNAKDGEWQAAITAISKKNCSVQAKKQTRPQNDEPDIWLCFAPVKNAPINNLVQKATELGASRLIPVQTQRTVVSRVNTDRLRLIAIEAAEQSGRLTVPQIDEPVQLDKLLDRWGEDRGLILCDESGGGKPFAKALKDAKFNKYAIIIGPEGGFTQSEFEIMKNKPYVIGVGMGPRILRADTAAIVALASFMNILGDWDEQPNFVE